MDPKLVQLCHDSWAMTSHSISKIKTTGSLLGYKLTIQLIMPSAFDEAGIRMLDSIREIFDIADFEFESVNFDLIQYNNFEEFSGAIQNGKCPVVDVLREYIYPGEKGRSHVMVATGIKTENGIKNIQLKNSFADSPIEQG